jgi:hypothetical protein
VGGETSGRPVTPSSDRQSDEAVIGELLLTLVGGFRDLDAARLESTYAEDADWTNAFGTSRHGRDAIVAYLKELFADPRFAAGKLVGRPENDVAAEALSELDSWSAASLRLNPHRLWEFGTREQWLLEHGGKPVRVIERSLTSCPEGRAGTQRKPW